MRLLVRKSTEVTTHPWSIRLLIRTFDEVERRERTSSSSGPKTSGWMRVDWTTLSIIPSMLVKVAGKTSHWKKGNGCRACYWLKSSSIKRRKRYWQGLNSNSWTQNGRTLHYRSNSVPVKSKLRNTRPRSRSSRGSTDRLGVSSRLLRRKKMRRWKTS